MKIPLSFLATAALIASAEAKEPLKKARRTVPGPYPSIIQIAPAGQPATTAPAGIIQSELGGREMQFLQSANRAGIEQLALANLAKSRAGSEQIKALAEMFASTQATENKELQRLAAEKHVALSVAPELTGEMTALSGAKFEKAWIEKLFAVSEAGVAAYEIGSKAEDPAIRAFAEKMLPVAQTRLQLASRLSGHSVGTQPEAPKPVDSAPRPIPPPIATPAPAKR